MSRRLLFFCCYTFISLVGLGQREVSTASLLKELVNPAALAAWPDPYYKVVQASSYDRRSISPDKPGWFANNDASQFIRTEMVDGHKEYVMLDADGPGAVVRFWLTTFKREGKLRIYFNNSEKPAIIIPAYDLMKIGLPLGKGLLMPHSSYEPKEKGGSTLYLPMPFSKHCKVTWEDAEAEVKQPRYYQIDYRKYEAGTSVKTFSPEELQGLGGLADQVSSKLLHPEDAVKGKRLVKSAVIEPGGSLRLDLPAGAAAVRLLQLSLDVDSRDAAGGRDDSKGKNDGRDDESRKGDAKGSGKRGDDSSRGSDGDYERALNHTLIRISFDGVETVNCPLDDYSGSGVGGKEIQSWYRTVSAAHLMSSRWVMPYRHSAVISIENTGTERIRVNMKAVTDVFSWNSRTLYFHASWKKENGIEVKNSETGPLREWALSRIRGKGIFAGETFSVYNHMHAWYGEGDQKLWIDRDTFPSEYGTGTEDYYNTSWAPVVLFQTPFANATRADNKDSYGANTFTRTRNLDASPFKNDFRYTLEMQGWKDGRIDASAAAYWYGSLNAKMERAEDAQEGTGSNAGIATPEWRPHYHFTPEKNWTNDPNGLLFLNGVYHMYNQQNPFGNEWGHMSWGHSTSKDLVHWKHLPIALPEAIGKDTTWRFSGSAVYDAYNSSGLCKGGGCIVAVYTADQPNLKKESQFVAYSNDGGRTFSDYAKNPVIDLHLRDFRDPNVSWNDELGQWLMVVALPTEHKVRFYQSPNLTSWSLLSEFGPWGYTGGVWECPSIFRLPVEGQTGMYKWVLTVSCGGGPHGGPFVQYFVGDLSGGHFSCADLADKIRTFDHGNTFYASIPWNGQPKGKKTYIGWMVPEAQPTYPWRGNMSIPRDLSLRQTDEGTVLLQEPAAIIRKVLPVLSGGRIWERNGIAVQGALDLGQRKEWAEGSFWLEATMRPAGSGRSGFTLVYDKVKGEGIHIGYDPSTHMVYVDRRHSDTSGLSKDKIVQTMPVSLRDGVITLTILVDKSTLEVFANDGESVLTTLIFPGKEAKGLSLFAENGEMRIERMKVWGL